MEGLSENIISTKPTPTEIFGSHIDSVEKALGVCLLKFKKPTIGLFQILPANQTRQPMSAFLHKDGIQLFDELSNTYSTYFPVYGKNNRIGEVNCLMEKITSEDGEIISFRAYNLGNNIEFKGRLVHDQLPEFQNRGIQDVRLSFVPEEIEIPIGKPLVAPKRNKKPKPPADTRLQASLPSNSEYSTEQADINIEKFSLEAEKDLLRNGYDKYTLGGLDISTMLKNPRFYSLYHQSLKNYKPNTHILKTEVAVRSNHPFVLDEGKSIGSDEDQKFNYTFPNQQLQLLQNPTFSRVTRANTIRDVKNGTLSLTNCIELDWQYRLKKGGEALIDKSLGLFRGLRMQEFSIENTNTGQTIPFTRCVAYNGNRMFQERSITTETLVPAVLLPKK